MLFRIERNEETGVETRIDQIAIRTAEGEQMCIDVGEDIPEGWYQFDPVTDPVPVPEQVPVSITRRQGRLALLQAGKLEAVESAIAAIEDPIARMAAKIEYETANWERSNQRIDAIGELVGLTPAEIDQLFIIGAGL